MMMTQLIADIDRYLAERKRAGREVAESTFGRLAANDGKLMARLREGKEVMPRTERKIRQFIEDNPAETSPGAGSGHGAKAPLTSDQTPSAA